MDIFLDSLELKNIRDGDEIYTTYENTVLFYFFLVLSFF